MSRKPKMTPAAPPPPPVLPFSKELRDQLQARAEALGVTPLALCEQFVRNGLAPTKAPAAAEVFHRRDVPPPHPVNASSLIRTQRPATVTESRRDPAEAHRVPAAGAVGFDVNHACSHNKPEAPEGFDAKLTRGTCTSPAVAGKVASCPFATSQATGCQFFHPRQRPSLLVVP